MSPALRASSATSAAITITMESQFCMAVATAGIARGVSTEGSPGSPRRPRSTLARSRLPCRGFVRSARAARSGSRRSRRLGEGQVADGTAAWSRPARNGGSPRVGPAPLPDRSPGVDGLLGGDEGVDAHLHEVADSYRRCSRYAASAIRCWNHPLFDAGEHAFEHRPAAHASMCAKIPSASASMRSSWSPRNRSRRGGRSCRARRSRGR